LTFVYFVVGFPAHHIYRFARLHGFEAFPGQQGAFESAGEKTELVQMMIGNFDPRYF
jgi:hypothetical protein